MYYRHVQQFLVHRQVKVAINSGQHKIINLFRTLWDFCDFLFNKLIQWFMNVNFVDDNMSQCQKIKHTWKAWSIVIDGYYSKYLFNWPVVSMQINELSIWLKSLPLLSDRRRLSSDVPFSIIGSCAFCFVFVFVWCFYFCGFLDTVSIYLS